MGKLGYRKRLLTPFPAVLRFAVSASHHRSIGGSGRGSGTGIGNGIGRTGRTCGLINEAWIMLRSL